MIIMIYMDPPSNADALRHDRDDDRDDLYDQAALSPRFCELLVQLLKLLYPVVVAPEVRAARRRLLDVHGAIVPDEVEAAHLAPRTAHGQRRRQVPMGRKRYTGRVNERR